MISSNPAFIALCIEYSISNSPLGPMGVSCLILSPNLDPNPAANIIMDDLLMLISPFFTKGCYS